MSDARLPAWVREVVKVTTPHIPAEFVGRIELNVFKGGVATVAVLQTFKPEGR
jgi:hypothetical protein